MRLMPPQGAASKDRTELLALYQQFLKAEEQRICLAHHAGSSGLEVAKRRAELIDAVLENLYTQALAQSEASDDKEPLAIIATGGYGRSLLNPASDIDVHFIHATRKAPSAVEREIIEQILYMLWDVGFKVGHAVRSVKETLNQANQDMKTKSSLIEARLVCGDQSLFERLKDEFQRNCIDGYKKDYLGMRRSDMRERREKYQTIYVQEPHLKNGCGGLRDYHNLIWITFVHFGTTDIRILVKKRIITKQEIEEVEATYNFLHHVRNELHYQAGRENDILTLHLQGVVATNFGYPSKNILRRVEAFMRDYYHNTRNLYRQAWKVLERLHLANEEEDEGGVVSFLARRRKKREHFGKFYSWNRRLYPAAEDIFQEQPYRMMRAFQHQQQRHLRASPELMELVRQHEHLVTKEYRSDKKVRAIFEAILSRRGDVARVLRSMHRTGFLGAYLPEFGELDCLVQHEFFHRYTADHHTLMCIRKLDELADSTDSKESFYRDLFHRVEDCFVLYLAFILHDTGRAENVRYHSDASAVMAARVCRRMQIRGDRRALLLFLVDHHLTFWKTATTLPLDDPDTISTFAAQMGNRVKMDLLLLFTYADSKGTSDSSWTEWKEMLIRQLYYATLEYWKDSNSSQTSSEAVKATVQKFIGDDYAQEIDLHFKHMPERYFASRRPQDIGRDIRLIRKFTRGLDGCQVSGKPKFRWVNHPEANYSEFIVCSNDRRMLLAYTTGVLSSQEMNILSADFFYRDDGIVIDVFRVCTTGLEAVTNTSVRDAVKKLMGASFDEKPFDFSSSVTKARRKNPIDSPEARVFPQRVFIDNESHPTASLIQIQAIDRLGLLYSCFMAIGKLGLEVTQSRIMTEKGAAIDTIYVKTPAGTKVTDAEQLQHLQWAMDEVIELPCE